MIMVIRPYHEDDEGQVIELWRQCGLTRPWNDPAKDIQRKLEIQPDMFLVGIIDDDVIGSVMAGYEGHRGWIYYLAVAPHAQHQGYGKRLMEHAEGLLREVNCPKINLLIRTDNVDAIEFYRGLDYSMDAVTAMGKRLVPDD